MFLCPACHGKSSCGFDVHLDIRRKKCAVCGHVVKCFKCDPAGVIQALTISQRLVAQYRHTQQLGPYRKINI